MYKRLLLLILLASFLKELTWASLIPLWHFPDEQSHVGQAAYLAETGITIPYGENNLTEEIRKSEELLGTQRDQLGINKFTYHPEYRIPYTTTYTGRYEHIINNLATDHTMRAFTKQEASQYPNFYYALLANVYRAFYDDSLIDRVFLMRIIQTVLFLATIYLTVKIGRLMFPSDPFFALTLAILVSFQPMFSFVGAGVNSDNIGNFMFTFYIYIVIASVKNKLSGPFPILLSIATVVTIYFKPQFLIVLPLTIILFALHYPTILFRRSVLVRNLVICIAVLWLSIFLYNQRIITPPAVVAPFLENLNLGNLSSFMVTYALPHAYREALPWYWGIYDWLGVTYPRYIHRPINYLILFSMSGFIIWLIRQRHDWSFKAVLILLGISCALFFGIYSYDWLSFVQTNIHLGVQGRYFFPLIVTHMTFIYIGWRTLLPKRFVRFQIIWNLLPGILMMVLSTYALVFVSSFYYDLSSFQSFLTQASQYKPWFFKGAYLVTLLLLYSIALIALLVEYVRYGQKRVD